MSNEISAPPQFDASDFMARVRAYEARATALYPANKAALMAAFAAAGITSVVVTFDGYGDSGQIENCEVKAGDRLVDLPDTPVEIARTEFFCETVDRRSEPLREAIESVCYLILEAKHGGWENNEGAYGEFVFDVAAGTVTLDFNYRIETTENHSYEF